LAKNTEIKGKVLVAEKISPEGVALLKERFEVDAHDSLSREELLERIGEYDALIVRSGTKVDSEVIRRANRLKIIGRAGIGVDNIDLQSATKKGIIVANVPESNVISAAEHTMAMILSLARRIPFAHHSLSSGEWKRSKFQGVELFGKTLGILGLGRIGSLVAERASSFGMKLVGYDPFISEQKAKRLGVEMLPLDDVLQRADILTLHVPKTKETYHLIDKESISKMKNGAMIVNVSRGGIIDEEALIEAIKSGRIAGAALDVFECEPPKESELCRMEQVIVTPHLGASTTEAQYKAGVAIAEQVIAALEGGFVGGAVNISMPHREVVETLKPYLPLAEKLGRLITHVSQSAISEVELEYLGDISEHDTSLLTVAFLKGAFETVSTETVTYVNAPLIAMERGIMVKESKSRKSRDYVNLIMASAKNGKKVHAGATLIGKRGQEIFVNVLEYEIEISPSDYIAFVTYEDKPGMIGKVGMILGEHNINISSLQVGRRVIAGIAGMGLTLDQPLSQEIIERLKGEEGIMDAIFIVL